MQFFEANQPMLKTPPANRAPARSALRSPAAPDR
jgi:hypothetical protein